MKRNIGHYFSCPLSVATSCRLLYRINVAHPADSGGKTVLIKNEVVEYVDRTVSVTV